jgi:quinol monooxygenase YgiN
MISFTVRMTFPPQDRDELTEALVKLTEASRQEPDCVNYIAHWIDGEPAMLLIYEQYEDAAALEHHRHTPHFAELATGVLYQKMLLRSVEEMAAIS